jgi:hypothetical protein
MNEIRDQTRGEGRGTARNKRQKWDCLCQFKRDLVAVWTIALKNNEFDLLLLLSLLFSISFLPSPPNPLAFSLLSHHGCSGVKLKCN